MPGNAEAAARRSVCRAKVTRQFNKIAESVPSKFTDTEKRKWARAVQDLATQLKEFDALVEEGLDPENGQMLEEEFEGQSSYNDKIAELELFAERHCVTESIRPRPCSVACTDGSQHERQLKIKLPVVNIPVFDGEYLQWYHFSRVYDELVHNNDELTVAMKFHYLRNSLKGSALKVIEGMAMTDANYVNALEVLCKKYDRPELVEKMHIKALLDVDPIKGVNDTKGVRRVLETFQYNIKALNSMGVKRETYGRQVFDALTRALPIEITRATMIKRKGKREEEEGSSSRGSTAGHAGLSAGAGGVMSDHAAYLDALLDDLQERIDADNMLGVDASCTARPREKSTRDFPARYTSKPPAGPAKSTIAFATSVRNSCVFCKGEHKDMSCKSSMSLQDRKDALRRTGACFTCFSRDHPASQCRAKVTCGRCGRRHVTFMHDNSWSGTPYKATEASTSASAKTSKADKDAEVQRVMSNVAIDSAVSFETACVRATVENGYVETRVLLDTGSACSFVRDGFAVQHHLQKIGVEDHEIYALGSVVPMSVTTPRYKIELANIRGGEGITLEVLGIPEISEAVRTLPGLPRALTKRVKGITLADRVGEHCILPVELLLGADALSAVYTLDAPIRVMQGVIARNTVFGHVFVGARETSPRTGTPVAANLCVMTAVAVSASAKRAAEVLWELETIGIQAADLQQDKGADTIKRFTDGIERNEGRYSVDIPVSEKIDQLKSNRRVAETLLRHQLANLARNEGRRQMYGEAMAKYVEGQFVERVPVDELEKDRMVFYMPHHPVFKPDSVSTPVRVVFNCSSHSGDEKSLNELVDQGPNLNRNVVEMLLRFREGRVALTADIRKAFLQIGVKPEYRDLFRYLWEEDGQTVHYRFKTLPFGCNASPFLLLATLRHHLSLQPSSPALEKLHKGFYMDDLIISCVTTDEAMHAKEFAVRLLREAGMELTKFNSNEPRLWDESTTEDPVVKVLGLRWNRETDEFLFCFAPVKLDGARLTKRKMLSVLASLFDPLGALSPVICAGKVMFQNACRESLKWNDAVPETIGARFKEWANQLDELRGVSFPRYLHISAAVQSIELHVFTDFSPLAYAAVAYLRVEDAEGVHVLFLLGRHRLAPLHNELTVPRGELVGALIGARMASYVTETITATLTRVVMWTDATVVLAWLQGEPGKYQKFVANRLVELKAVTAQLKATWRHCPGLLNPADRSTRGLTPEQLKADGLWLSGPPFLKRGPDEWPKDNAEHQEVAAAEEELRPAFVVATAVTGEKELIDLSVYSLEWRALKVAAQVLRFVKAVRPRGAVAGIKPIELIALQLQMDLFPKERQQVRIGQAVPSGSKLRSFKLMLDQHGLLRIVTRLSGQTTTYDEARPIVLAEHRFVSVMVRACHERLMHAGVAHLMTELRHTFYILRLRKICRQVVRDCVMCLRYRRHQSSLLAAPLPSAREECRRPFQNTGVDFTGPFHTRSGDATEKSYIALFTCLVTRAVHLEVVSRISTEAFLNALRRFVSLRQVPDVLFSDNALSFVKAKAELHKLFQLTKETEVTEYTQAKAIEWRFSIPYAPWTGGAWERLMRTMKAPLRKTVGTRTLTFEQLYTVVKEVEAVINARPLVAPTDDVEEPMVLTPAHFLHGGAHLSLPAGKATSSDYTSWARLREQLMNSLWKRFRTEYLLYLRNVNRNEGSADEVKEGEVFLLDEGAIPRNKWRLVRVQQVFPGRDGVPRSATVRTASGAIYKRSVRSLIPLEQSGIRPSSGEPVAARDDTVATSAGPPNQGRTRYDDGGPSGSNGEEDVGRASRKVSIGRDARNARE